MKVGLKVFWSNVLKFASERVAPALESDTQRFVLGFVLGGTGASKVLTENPMARALGLVDEQGNVDVGELEQCCRSGFCFQNVYPLDRFGLPTKGLTQDDADAFFGQFRASAPTGEVKT